MGDRARKDRWAAGWPCGDDCRLARPLGVAGWLWCAAPGKCERLWREGAECAQYELRGAGDVEAERAKVETTEGGATVG